MYSPSFFLLSFGDLKSSVVMAVIAVLLRVLHSSPVTPPYQDV